METIKHWMYIKLFSLWVMFGVRILRWEYIDIHAPKKKVNKDIHVDGITFSTSRRYVEAVSKIR